MFPTGVSSTTAGPPGTTNAAVSGTSTAGSISEGKFKTYFISAAM